MSLKLAYIVHSCVVEMIPQKAQLADGRWIDVMATGLTVELVPEDPNGKSQTECFVPEDVDAAQKLFAVGNKVFVTYEGEPVPDIGVHDPQGNEVVLDAPREAEAQEVDPGDDAQPVAEESQPVAG